MSAVRSPSKRKIKKLYYRRADWKNRNTRNLQAFLRGALKKLNTVDARTFENAQGSIIRGARNDEAPVDSNGSALFLHVTKHAPDEQASVVDKEVSDFESNVSTAPAPSGSDYMDSDIFALIKGNDVLVCPSGARESVLLYYLVGLARRMDEYELADSLELKRIAKVDKIKMIEEEGVREVVLKSSLYKASMMQIQKDRTRSAGFKDAVADAFAKFFGEEITNKEIKEAENLNIDLSIKFDGNQARRIRPKDPEYGKEGEFRLNEAAKALLDDFDEEEEDIGGFSIVTRQGNRIDSEHIQVNEVYRFDRYGKSIHFSNAMVALKAFYSNLKSNGVLSQ